MYQDQAASAGAVFPQHMNSDEMIRVTEAAREKLTEIVQSAAADGVTGVRVFVAGGGCSGLSYGMGLAEAPNPQDATWTSGDLALYIDAVALNYLEGAEIDYTEDDGARFLFRNVSPRSSGGGCGGGGCGGGSGGGCGGGGGCG